MIALLLALAAPADAIRLPPPSGPLREAERMTVAARSNCGGHVGRSIMMVDRSGVRRVTLIVDGREIVLSRDGTALRRVREIGGADFIAFQCTRTGYVFQIAGPGRGDPDMRFVKGRFRPR